MGKTSGDHTGIGYVLIEGSSTIAKPNVAFIKGGILEDKAPKERKKAPKSCTYCSISGMQKMNA